MWLRPKKLTRSSTFMVPWSTWNRTGNRMAEAIKKHAWAIEPGGGNVICRCKNWKDGLGI